MKRGDFKEIIELPKEFIGKGSVGGSLFKFKFVRTVGNKIVYKVNDSYYEVFNEVIRPKYTYKDGSYQIVKGIGRVCYPTDDNFGLQTPFRALNLTPKSYNEWIEGTKDPWKLS